MLGKALLDLRICRGIDGTRRVIEDQDLRFFQKRSGDTESLLLTAGYVSSALLDIGVISFRKSTDKRVCLRNLTCFDHLFIGRIRITPAEVFLDRSGEEDVLLKHHGNIISDHIEIVVLYIDTADLDVSLCCIIKSRDQLYE